MMLPSVRTRDKLRRLPLRIRLTLLFAGVFLLAGGAVVVVMYSIVALELGRAPGVSVAVRAPSVEPEETLHEPVTRQVSEDLVKRIESAEDEQNRATLRSLMWQSLVALGGVGIGGAALAHVMAGRALRPVARITSTARRVAETNLHERIGLVGPDDEIKELADTFDGMLARLDRSFNGQRHFVGNASHELRTPLAVIRTVLEVALADPDASADLRRVGHTLLETNARSERLIDGLLTLARSEQELTDLRVIDLAALTSDAVGTCEPEIASRGMKMTTSLEATQIRGNVELVSHLVLNLLQNSVRHNNAHRGEITVTTRQDTNGGEAVLEVANTGDRLSQADMERIFQPFVRLAHDRTGSDHGLGLAIAKAVVLAHGGSIFAKVKPEGGLTMTVRLPQVDPGSRAAP